MRILTNEYASNVPGSTGIGSGGPANFARSFGTYATKLGATWIGLIHEHGRVAHSPTIRTRFLQDSVRLFGFAIPEARYRGFLRMRRKQLPETWFAEELARIQRWMREERGDLLFLNGFSVFAWLLLKAAAREGIPVVIQHAGIATVEVDQYAHLFSRASREAMAEMEREVVELATRQVFLNAFSKRAFAAWVRPVPTAQAVIIPLPYDPLFAKGRRRRKTTEPKKQAFVVGCVARWDRIKNHPAVLAIAQAAKKRGAPLTFRSVTKIPTTTVHAQVKARYRRLIEIVPPMDRTALAAFYRSVDVLLLPSHFDVSPTVVMEAALCGTPTLIAPHVGWVSEYRAQGMGTWIIGMEDPERVLDRLMRCAGRPPTDAFVAHLRKTHAPAAVFRTYLRLFRSLCR